jgi:hypothetical protein
MHRDPINDLVNQTLKELTQQGLADAEFDKRGNLVSAKLTEKGIEEAKKVHNRGLQRLVTTKDSRLESKQADKKDFLTSDWTMLLSVEESFRKFLHEIDAKYRAGTLEIRYLKLGTAISRFRKQHELLTHTIRQTKQQGEQAASLKNGPTAESWKTAWVNLLDAIMHTCKMERVAIEAVHYQELSDHWASLSVREKIPEVKDEV